MKSKSRRYEVLLPVRFNNGRDVPDELLGETVFRDDLALLVVDVPDTAKNRKWMKAYKERWKKRLEQLELWMVSYPIDIE